MLFKVCELDGVSHPLQKTIAVLQMRLPRLSLFYPA